MRLLPSRVDMWQNRVHRIRNKFYQRQQIRSLQEVIAPSAPSLLSSAKRFRKDSSGKIIIEAIQRENLRVFQDQIRSVSQSCPTFCDPMYRSTPGLPVRNQLLEFIQTHVHQVNDAIQPSHPLSSPSPPAPNPSQHQSLFQ